MNEFEVTVDESQQVMERYELSLERIKAILSEYTVDPKFQSYFQTVSKFILQINDVLVEHRKDSWKELSLEELQRINTSLYLDIQPEYYATSYANPKYSVEILGEEYGQLLSALYAELRGEIAYVFEERISYLTICNELFIEIYNCFEETPMPEYKVLKDILYWYASDYCDVFLADRIQEQLDPKYVFAVELIEHVNMWDETYLYQFGEYITDNEVLTARHLNGLDETVIQQMADVYTEGYRMGFINGGKDLSKKSTVNIRYTLGFERVIQAAIKNFRVMGLQPIIYRAAVSIITKREQHKIGYYGASVNKQYEYDHRADQGLFMDKKYIERKLDVTKNTYEKNKELAAKFAGPAVMEVFGEHPFVPIRISEAIMLDEKQEQLTVLYDGKSGQLMNHYIKGEERSFTIIAYPIPEIGIHYKEIFDEVIRINTLDAKIYEQVQQKLIDALDQGVYVHVKGISDNGTDLKIQLHRLNDPEKETIFENCVADVNIPVGEVFTTPILENTNGILAVKKVYLNNLQYQNLKLTFSDGKIIDYSCTNFPDAEENKKYIKENILHNHDSLPIGEFAIGTNTTAYVAAKKYKIEDKMPILIAEKMGPHFAVGDTCYSWSEENKVYNPNGKEIVAKDNTISILRKEDIGKAYFQCHTDVTIPYEELKEIKVVTKDEKEIILLKNGRFVLPGTEVLNEPFANC
ncbi:MAG: aminopeptidase [Lachnospiraceae bacterium]